MNIKKIHMRGQNIRVLLASLMIYMVFIAAYPITNANSPENVSCAYDSVQKTLSVSITHDNSDEPMGHYIYKVEVQKNGALINTYTYTSQPSVSYTVLYDVTATDGDVLIATAYCSVLGSETGRVTVGEAVENNVSDYWWAVLPLVIMALVAVYFLMRGDQ